MIRQFDERYSSYVQLLEMLSVDVKAGTIPSDCAFAIDSYYAAHAADIGITEGRLTEYRQILMLPIMKKRIYLDGRRHNNDDFMLSQRAKKADLIRKAIQGEIL